MNQRLPRLATVFAVSAMMTLSSCQTAPADPTATTIANTRAVATVATYAFLRGQKDAATAAESVYAAADALPEDGVLTGNDVLVLAGKCLPPSPDAQVLAALLADYFARYSVTLGNGATLAAIRDGMRTSAAIFAPAPK